METQLFLKLTIICRFNHLFLTGFLFLKILELKKLKETYISHQIKIFLGKILNFYQIFQNCDRIYMDKRNNAEI